MITAETKNGNSYIIEVKNGVTHVNGKAMNIDKLLVHPGKYHWIVNNRSYRIELLEKGENKTYTLSINEKRVTISLKDKMDVLLKELGMDSLSANKVNDLKAPMPGLVVDIKVTEGQQVKKGDTIIVLEAMKMENALKAPADATVKKIAAIKGNAVEKNQVLVFLS
ncbi:MAG: biotin/lipoyl-containing protein [Bacteroidota bacterium]